MAQVCIYVCRIRRRITLLAGAGHCWGPQFGSHLLCIALYLCVIVTTGYSPPILHFANLGKVRRGPWGLEETSFPSSSVVGLLVVGSGWAAPGGCTPLPGWESDPKAGNRGSLGVHGPLWGRSWFQHLPRCSLTGAPICLSSSRDG